MNKPSNGINHWINSLKTNNEPTLLNFYDTNKISLKEKAQIDANEYKEFNDFFNSTVKKVSDELNYNKGPIIEYHLPDNNRNEEYIKAMQEIVDKYKELYLNNLKQDKKNHHKLTNDTTPEIYPNYLEDLYQKNENPYVDFEKQNGLTNPIVKQSDKEFLDTLHLRKKGLKSCIKNPENQDHNMDYFKQQYADEDYNLNFPNLSKTKSISTDMIKSQCKIFKLGLSKTEFTEVEFNKFKIDFEKFMEDNNYKETKLLKTVLPKEYFIIVELELL
jgi:hypothetical protein